MFDGADGDDRTTYYEMHMAAVPNFNYSNGTRFDDFMANNVSLTSIPEMTFGTSVTNVGRMFTRCPNVQSGAKDLYDTLSQIASITDHADTFTDCGSNTESGRAELAQIPTSWGGTLS